MVHSLEERFRPVAQTVQQMAPAVQQTRKTSSGRRPMWPTRRCAMDWMSLAEGWEDSQQVSRVPAWLDHSRPLCRGKFAVLCWLQAYRSEDVTRVAAFFTGFRKNTQPSLPLDSSRSRQHRAHPLPLHRM